MEPMKVCMEPIKVWRFKDAPQHLKNLSDNGGDEDWLVEIPAEYQMIEELFHWITVMDSGYEPKVYSHPYVPNRKVVIGSHG